MTMSSVPLLSLVVFIIILLSLVIEEDVISKHFPNRDVRRLFTLFAENRGPGLSGLGCEVDSLLYEQVLIIFIVALSVGLPGVPGVIHDGQGLGLSVRSLVRLCRSLLDADHGEVLELLHSLLEHPGGGGEAARGAQEDQAQNQHLVSPRWL